MNAQDSLILTEAKISLGQATRLVPVLDGRRPSTSTVWRWAIHGIQGVRLEHVWIGRKVATSREALDRFFVAIAQARLSRMASQSSPQSDTITQMQSRWTDDRQVSRQKSDAVTAVQRLRANGFEF